MFIYRYLEGKPCFYDINLPALIVEKCRCHEQKVFIIHHATYYTSRKKCFAAYLIEIVGVGHGAL